MVGDKVRVQTFVRVSIEDAFEVFTLELDAWWRRGPAYRVGGKDEGAMHLEPKLGGRVFQEYTSKKQAALHEIGVITAWDPPNHFAFTWRGINFKPHESTTVEVWFEPGNDGTRVTLEHRGFASLPDDHPVRHKNPVDVFIRDTAMWWGRLASSFREVAERRLP